MSIISLIVAMDENGLIGRGNALPWHLPVDLAYFKNTTMGKPIIMGRNTYESIGKPLPGRENVVITRQSDYRASGCTIVGSLEDAFKHCANVNEAVVIGGAQIYRQALPLVQRLYITRVHATLDGDAWFPEVDWGEWEKVSEDFVAADVSNDYAVGFELWDKVNR